MRSIARLNSKICYQLIPGAGTEFYRGMGAIVMFGVIGAALFTLTMLPALKLIGR